MIVGRDCDGKPLYVGDRVQRLNQVAIRHFSSIGVVRGPSDLQGKVLMDSGLPATTSFLRKLANDDKSDWTETEKATGWKPVREKVA